jgi:hypothetical protein
MAGEATLFQEQWDARVLHAYQSKGYLTRGMSIGPSKVEGKKLHFPILGKGIATEYTVRDTVKKMNLMKGEVLLDASEWDAADDIYQYDLDRMAPAMKDSIVEAAGMALGRRHDLVLFQKMWDFNFNGISQVVGAFTDTALPGPGNILAARRRLFELDVPVDDGQNFCGVPPVVFDNLMSFEVFANSQWTGGNLPFADGLRRRTWQNINFFELPVYLQNIQSTTQGKFYMWHKSALGTGYTGEPLRTGWEWILSQKKWYYQSTISAGATIITDTNVGHPPGIIELRYKADLLPTFT